MKALDRRGQDVVGGLPIILSATESLARIFGTKSLPKEERRGRGTSHPEGTGWEI